jgi:hypothetical protein
MNRQWYAVPILFAATALAAAEKPLVLPPERLAKYWLLVSGSAQSANVPNSGYNLDAPTCAAVSYVVEKDGSTSHVTLERMVPPGDLGKVAVNIVAAMRFAPTPDNLDKRPVRTYVVIPFNVPGAESTSPADRAQRARVLEACKLEGFTGKPGD